VNYYLVLGVPQDADADTIRRAFRALARRYHPDAGQGSSAERFRQIATAYETLTDPIRRQAYDRTLETRRPRTADDVEPLVPQRPPNRWSAGEGMLPPSACRPSRSGPRAAKSYGSPA
jgi:curved DNA-binding protein CbpA